MFRKRRLERSQADQVPEVSEDQTHNPFTEIVLLSSHADIVHLLMVIDEQRLVSAGDDCSAVIWHCKSGKRLSVLRGHSRPITCMMLHHHSADLASDDDFASMLLLTGSSDKLICVWDMEAGQCLHTLTDHNSSVKCIVSMPDESCFLSGGQDLCLWDAQGVLLYKMERKAEHSDIHTVLPIKNNRIVTASNKASLVVYSVIKPQDDEDSNARNIVMFKKLSPHRESIRCLISVADSMFASASLDGAIVLWSTHTMSYTRQLNYMKNYEGPNHMYPYSVQHLFAVEQKYIFASVGHGFFLYDAMSGNCLAQVRNAHFGKIAHSLLLRNGYILATCSEDGSVRLWGGSTGPVNFDGVVNTPQILSSVDKFLGRRLKDLQGSSKQVEPILLGECLAHSGTVHMAVDCGHEGFASCGSDDLVILWKDGNLQSERRNEIVQQILLYENDF